MYDRSASVLLHTSNLHVPGVGGVVAMERLGDSRGDEEHPVQIVAVFTQRLTGNKAFRDGLPVLIPFEVHVQIYTLAATVVSGAEDVGVPGNLPAIFPMAVHEEILVRQVSHTLQPVLQLLEYLLCHGLAGILQLAGVRL